MKAPKMEMFIQKQYRHDGRMKRPNKGNYIKDHTAKVGIV